VDGELHYAALVGYDEAGIIIRGGARDAARRKPGKKICGGDSPPPSLPPPQLDDGLLIHLEERKLTMPSLLGMNAGELPF
jgi:hypothetical protein